MSGEKSLEVLLKHLEPELNPGEYVFCTVDSLEAFNEVSVVASIQEKEGITIVLERRVADSLELSYEFVSSWITLTVHSSLDAVGLTAAFSNALSKQNISCNVIAGYYHDHLFVNVSDTERALKALKQLKKET